MVWKHLSIFYILTKISSDTTYLLWKWMFGQNVLNACVWEKHSIFVLRNTQGTPSVFHLPLMPRRPREEGWIWKSYIVPQKRTRQKCGKRPSIKKKKPLSSKSPKPLTLFNSFCPKIQQLSRYLSRTFLIASKHTHFTLSIYAGCWPCQSMVSELIIEIIHRTVQHIRSVFI